MTADDKLRVANLWVLADAGLSLILEDREKELWPAVAVTVGRLNDEVKSYVERGGAQGITQTAKRPE